MIILFMCSKATGRLRPINTAIDKMLKENRRIRFDYVRTEGKLLMSLLTAWRLLTESAEEQE